jgi:hypothetical protein
MWQKIALATIAMMALFSFLVITAPDAMAQTQYTCKQLLEMGPNRAMDISMDLFDRWNDCYEATLPKETSPVYVWHGDIFGLRKWIEQLKSDKMMECALYQTRCGFERIFILFRGQLRQVILP